MRIPGLEGRKCDLVVDGKNCTRGSDELYEYMYWQNKGTGGPGRNFMQSLWTWEFMCCWQAETSQATKAKEAIGGSGDESSIWFWNQPNLCQRSHYLEPDWYHTSERNLVQSDSLQSQTDFLARDLATSSALRSAHWHPYFRRWLEKIPLCNTETLLKIEIFKFHLKNARNWVFGALRD